MEIIKLIKIKASLDQNEKIYVKIISPNFDLRYGLSLKEIEEELIN